MPIEITNKEGNPYLFKLLDKIAHAKELTSSQRVIKANTWRKYAELIPLIIVEEMAIRELAKGELS